MSYGFCGSNNNIVGANLRIDSTGVRFTVAADVALSINAGASKNVTFTVVVPKNVGFSSVDWATLIPTGSGSELDYVGWVTNGDLVSSSVTTEVYYSALTITQATALTVDPADTLFSKFSLGFTLTNGTAESFSCQKLISGFTYSKNPPNTGSVKFDIYATVKIV
jgi:hypothetical protein